MGVNILQSCFKCPSVIIQVVSKVKYILKMLLGEDGNRALCYSLSRKQ